MGANTHTHTHRLTDPHTHTDTQNNHTKPSFPYSGTCGTHKHRHTVISYYCPAGRAGPAAAEKLEL